MWFYFCKYLSRYSVWNFKLTCDTPSEFQQILSQKQTIKNCSTGKSSRSYLICCVCYYLMLNFLSHQKWGKKGKVFLGHQVYYSKIGIISYVYIFQQPNHVPANGNRKYLLEPLNSSSRFFCRKKKTNRRSSIDRYISVSLSNLDINIFIEPKKKLSFYTMIDCCPLIIEM